MMIIENKNPACANRLGGVVFSKTIDISKNLNYKNFSVFDAPDKTLCKNYISPKKGKKPYARIIQALNSLCRNYINGVYLRGNYAEINFYSADFKKQKNAFFMQKLYKNENYGRSLLCKNYIIYCILRDRERELQKLNFNFCIRKWENRDTFLYNFCIKDGGGF